MRLGWLLVFTTYFLLLQISFSQTPCEDLGITDTLGFNTTITVVDDGIIDPGDEFCVEFSVENFEFVIGFQFTLSFDPTVISYAFHQTTPGVLLGPLGANVSQVGNGVLSFVWTNLNAEGQTLPDGTEIFIICFQAIGEPNDCSSVFFNDYYPFFPELEVNYQIDENTTCSDTILLLDGAEETIIKIECTDLTITDVTTCNADPTNGSLGFSACGGVLPYSYQVTNNANPVVLNGTINQDGDEIFFATVPAALFTIMITDANGAIATRVVNIESGPSLEFDSSVVDPNCPEAETGKIIITDIRGGVPGLSGYTMEASTGQFFQNTFSDSLIRLISGDYTVTITDDNGCEQIEMFSLNTPEIELLIEIDTASCFGSSDGSVRIFPSGGTPFPGGEYIINGALSTSFESNMPFQDPNFFSIDNKFVVTVEDANGCMVEERLDIPTRAELEVQITELIDVACKGDSSGSARITVITPGRYVFLLTDEIGNFVSAIGSVIGNVELFYNGTLPEGFYNLSITDTDLGCHMDTFFVINEPLEELMITEGSDPPSCNENNGIAYVEASGGIAPYTYNWAFAPAVDNDTLGNLGSGTYMVLVTDDMGCTIETSIEVEDGDILDIQIDIISSLECDGSGQGELNGLVVQSSFQNLTYEWTNMNGDMLGDEENLLFPTAGDYILNVSDVAASCSDSDTVFIDPAGIFSFEISASNPSCEGSTDGSIDISNFLGGVGPYNCDWEDSSISSCNPTNLSAGIYNLSISDSAGCIIDTFIELSDSDAAITFDISFDNPSCVEAIDGTISFTNFQGGVGPYECIWEDPNVIGCPRTGLPAGIYMVTIVDAVGCQKDTSITLTDPEAIQIDVLDSDVVDVSCFGGSDGQALVTVTNNPSGAASFNFAWSNSADDNSGGFIDDASQLSAGLNYVLAFDNNSCSSDTLFFNVGEPEMLHLDFDITSIMMPTCSGNCDAMVTLQATGGTSVAGNYSYEWDDGSTAVSRNNLCPGIYYVMISDDNNCQELDSIIIEEPDILTVEIDLNGTVELSCFGDETGAILVRAFGGCGSYSYEWTNNVSTTQRAENLAEGLYTITVTDDCGCSQTVEYELVTSAPIIATIIDPVLPDCFGGTSCIGVESVSGGVGNNYTYSINFGERIPIDSCVDVIAGMYNISVFDSVGCSETYTSMVDQPSMIEVDLGPDLTLDLGDSTATITATINSLNPIDSIIWISSSQYNCISDNCETININTNEYSTYEVLVIDQNGCQGKDEIEINISAKRNVYISNIFNPTELAPNDMFMILTGEGVVELQYLRIFDRWGNLMFEKENISHPTSIDDGWNGRFENRQVEQGVYIYVASVRFVDNKIIQYKGDITLVR